MSGPATTALLEALAGRAVMSIDVFYDRRLRSPNPWPDRSALSGLSRADSFFAWWHVARAAAEFSRAQLITHTDRKAVRGACDRLLLVAKAFALIEVAGQRPTGENLATLVFIGAQLARMDQQYGHPPDLLWDAPPVGRPLSAGGYELDDAPFVLELANRVAAGEAPAVAKRDIALRMNPLNGNVKSKMDRLSRRFRAK